MVQFVRLEFLKELLIDFSIDFESVLIVENEYDVIEFIARGGHN